MDNYPNVLPILCLSSSKMQLISIPIVTLVFHLLLASQVISQVASEILDPVKFPRKDGLPIASTLSVGTLSRSHGSQSSESAKLVKRDPPIIDKCVITLDKVLDCSNLDISCLPTEVLILEPVEEVHFRFNKLSSLHEPISSKHGLNLLDFSYNKLEFIDKSVFSNLSSLRSLNLAHNLLWELNDGQFSLLPKLTRLDLSFNSIDLVDEDWFEGCTAIKQLNLRHNPIRFTDNGVFSHLVKLENLDLSGCQLGQLPEDVFSYNQNLVILDLAENSLKRVPSKALSHLSKLKFLNLGGNQFTSLDYPAFSKLQSLATLRLEHLPKLESIGSNAFQGLNSLKSFYCSYNSKLRTVDPKAFFDNQTERNIELEEFVFRSNSVSQLSADLLDWKALNQTDLSNNPWRCDCHLAWIVQVRMSKPTKNGAKCERPRTLKDHIIAEISVEEFKCSSLFNDEFFFLGAIMLIITISMTVVVFLYILIKISPCLTKCKNPCRRSYGYSKVKVTRNGPNYDLQWDAAENQ